MPHGGILDEAKRAAVVRYLQTLDRSALVAFVTGVLSANGALDDDEGWLEWVEREKSRVRRVRKTTTPAWREGGDDRGDDG